MASAIFFDLWNTLLFCPTRDRVLEMIDALGLGDTLDYDSVIEGMRKTIFVDRDYDFGRLISDLCQDEGVECGERRLQQAKDIWGSRLHDAHFFPETIAVLTELKGEHKLGVISNVDAGGADHAMPLISDYFDTLIMSCDAGVAKPDPMIFELALEEAGADPGDSWMVGDSVRVDVDGALNAGLSAVLIDRAGKHPVGEYPVISNLAQLAEVTG